MSQSWTRFTKSITLRSTPEELYHAFATANGMESWFLRTCNYMTTGGITIPGDQLVQQADKYRWLWFGYGDESDENGEILEANGRDLFEFTFNANGKTDMRVNVNFCREQDEFRVNLTQYNIPEDDTGKRSYYVGCGEGWTFYLANLKSVLEGGIDLRNKNELIKGVINS